MNALVYDNKGKDINATWLKKLIKSLDEAEIPSRVIDDDDLSKDISADVLFVLGGDDKSMFVICEDYQNDKVFMQQITSMPRAGKVPMEQVANSSVKKVSDIWNYHHNAFMGFGVF